MESVVAQFGRTPPRANLASLHRRPKQPSEAIHLEHLTYPDVRWEGLSCGTPRRWVNNSNEEATGPRAHQPCYEPPAVQRGRTYCGEGSLSALVTEWAGRWFFWDSLRGICDFGVTGF